MLSTQRSFVLNVNINSSIYNYMMLHAIFSELHITSNSNNLPLTFLQLQNYFNTFLQENTFPFVQQTAPMLTTFRER